jgi:hypothetical protein
MPGSDQLKMPAALFGKKGSRRDFSARYGRYCIRGQWTGRVFDRQIRGADREGKRC